MILIIYEKGKKEGRREGGIKGGKEERRQEGNGERERPFNEKH